MVIEIGTRRIGAGLPAFVIAEAGVNHNGDVGRALDMVDAAARAGADAIKFQTFRAKELVSPDAGCVPYQLREGETATSQLELLESLELRTSDFEALRKRADERGIEFLSSPHTESAVDELAPLVRAFKLGSGDLDHVLLLRRVARHGKPVILGTGMATLDEVQRAAAILTEAGATELVFLHATTQYPCPLDRVHLRAMSTMAHALAPHGVGYSDHTEDIEVSIVAAALGASVIEKHFTLDRTLPGPDHAASIEPDQLAHLARAVHAIPTILGSDHKLPTPEEERDAPSIRKSLTAATDLPSGTILEPEHLRGRRPATGIAVSRADEVIGRRLGRALAAGERLAESDF